MKKNKHFMAVILLTLMLVVGLTLFAFGTGPFSTVRMIMDQISPDGEMESFTTERHAALRIPLLGIGVIFSLLGGLGLVFIKRTDYVWGSLLMKGRAFFQQCWCDGRDYWRRGMSPKFYWWEWVVLGLLILLAFAGRWVWVEKPMLHDESYTFIAFAQRPFIKVISDYHLPNNHVFNTILIHFLYSIFGNPSPMVVRLPALLAGVLCVPMGYVWARQQYGIRTAWMAAALITYFPWLKLQSTNGRGYMLMAALTLLMLILAEQTRTKKNRPAWALLIVVTVLNFYTLPIALYPFGILCVWLLASAVVGDIAAEYGGFWGFIKYLAVFGFVSGCLTLLLYSPVFLLGSGWDSFFHNPFVESLSWYDFMQTLPVRLAELVTDWQMDVPLWFSIFLVLGVVLSIVFHRQSVAGKVPLQVCAAAALAVIFAVQRPNPWTRIWTYLLPVLLVWAAAGWFLFLDRLLSGRKLQNTVLNLALAAMFGVVLLLSYSHLAGTLQYFRGEMGQEETVTLALKELVTADDIVLTSVGFGPAFWYYFDRQEMPLQTIVNPEFQTGWQRVFFVVDGRENQSYADLLAEKPISTEDCPADTLVTVYEYGHYRVYVCAPLDD